MNGPKYFSAFFPVKKGETSPISFLDHLVSARLLKPTTMKGRTVRGSGLPAVFRVMEEGPKYLQLLLSVRDKGFRSAAIRDYGHYIGGRPLDTRGVSYLVF
jgi:hypothetical protein